MKKLSIVLAIVLCAAVFFCVPVSATGEVARLYVKARGTEITVTVKTTAAVGALQGAVKYNKDVFGYEGASANSAILANNATASSFQNVSGATKFALVGDPSSGTNGEWATVTYSADLGTPAVFEFTGVKAFDTNGANLGAASNKIIMPGDVNNDNLVTIKDYVRLKRHYSNSVATSGEADNKDVNMDGASNYSDISYLRSDLLEN